MCFARITHAVVKAQSWSGVPALTQGCGGEGGDDALGYHLVLPMAPVLSQLYVSQKRRSCRSNRRSRSLQAVDRAHGTGGGSHLGQGKRGPGKSHAAPLLPTTHLPLPEVPSSCFSPSCKLLQVSLPSCLRSLNLQISVMGPTPEAPRANLFKKALDSCPRGDGQRMWKLAPLHSHSVRILPTPTLFSGRQEAQNKVQQQPGIETQS